MDSRQPWQCHLHPCTSLAQHSGRLDKHHMRQAKSGRARPGHLETPFTVQLRRGEPKCPSNTSQCGQEKLSQPSPRVTSSWKLPLPPTIASASPILTDFHILPKALRLCSLHLEIGTIPSTQLRAGLRAGLRECRTEPNKSQRETWEPLFPRPPPSTFPNLTFFPSQRRNVAQHNSGYKEPSLHELTETREVILPGQPGQGLHCGSN